MKKLIRLNEYERGEYTVEEILEKYNPYIKKASYESLCYLQKFGNHSSHIDLQDLEQVAIIGAIKAYNKYSIDFTSKNVEDSNDCIGFFPLLEKTVLGELKRFCRDLLKTRRKDYNIHEIVIKSLNEPVKYQDNEKERELIETLDLKETDCYNQSEDNMYLQKLLSNLNEKEMQVVKCYYYLDKGQAKTGELLNMSQAQVSRILKRSLKKLKKYAEEEKGENVVAKVKTLNFTHLMEYLTNSVDQFDSIDKAIEKYIELNDVVIDEIHSSLNKRKASYKSIKDLYENKNNKVIEKDIKPKSIEKTPIKKSINTDVLKEVNIVNLTVDINEIRADFTPQGINLYNMKLKDLTVEDLVKLQENIQKVIEINNTIYK